MLNWREHLIRRTFIFSDIIYFIIGCLSAIRIYEFFENTEISYSHLEGIGFLSLVIFINLILLVFSHSYKDTVRDYKQLKLMTLFKTCSLTIIGTLILTQVMRYIGYNLTSTFYLSYSISLIIFIVLNRIMFSFIYARIFTKKTINILLIGVTDKGKDYVNELKKRSYLDTNLIGYLDGHKNDEISSLGYEKLEFLGLIEDFMLLTEKYVIDEITITKSINSHISFHNIMDRCNLMGITVNILLEFEHMDRVKSQVEKIGQTTFVKLHTVSLDETQLLVKRIVDVVLGSIGMFAFGLLFIVFGPLIKLTSKGPILFKQKRVGRHGRVFDFWKFRTMQVNAEDLKKDLENLNEMNGQMFKIKNDPRVTPLGRFLRKTSIDEFPQFYNVLKGDMSIVGTRPPTLEEVNQYQSHERMRISITPGITGMWQTNGRSEIKNFDEVIKIDIDYIRNWSLWLDFIIIFKTVYVVIFQKGSE